MSKYINTFDIDGVIYQGRHHIGVFPGQDDVIITGRSIEEERETIDMLRSRGITNRVFFNNVPFDEKTRKTSGQHKGRTMFYLEEMGYRIGIHFEDDPIQVEEIKKIMPDVTVVLLTCDKELVNKENERHDQFQII